MDQERFDELAKALATTRLSRGQALKGLGAGLVVIGVLPAFGGKSAVALDLGEEWSKLEKLTGTVSVINKVGDPDNYKSGTTTKTESAKSTLELELTSVLFKGTVNERREYDLKEGHWTNEYDDYTTGQGCLPLREDYRHTEYGSGSGALDPVYDFFELIVLPRQGIYWFRISGGSVQTSYTTSYYDCVSKWTDYSGSQGQFFGGFMLGPLEDEDIWQPLTGTTLSGSIVEGSLDDDYAGQTTVTWNLAGEGSCASSSALSAAAVGTCSTLEARPLVKSKKVARGGEVVLDGSKSTGDITSYTWTFGPGASGGCPDGVQPLSSAKKTGSKITVKALCSFTATLTVSDGTNENSKSVEVTVTPRKKWKTTFEHAKKEKPFTSAPPLTLGAGCQCAFGRNVCTLDGLEGDQSSGHWFHKEPDAIGWEGEGYAVAHLQDPGGPFDGYWYVAENKLRVLRTSLIHPDLYKTSETYKTNVAARRKRDIALLAGSVSAHERMHSTLVKEALEGGADPAQKVEAMVHPDKDMLVINTNTALSEAEEALQEASKEENVHERLKKTGWDREVTILLRKALTDEYAEYHIPSLAMVGDSGG